MTTLVDDRRMALKIGYRASDWAKDVKYHDFVAYFSDWEALAVMKETKCIGACFYHPETAEMHFSILPEWRCKWLSPSLMRRLKNMKKIVTRVPPGFDFMYDILKRFGFEENDDGTLIYGH